MWAIILLTVFALINCESQYTLFKKMFNPHGYKKVAFSDYFFPLVLLYDPGNAIVDNYIGYDWSNASDPRVKSLPVAPNYI
jgi:hypothetical protein